MPPPPRVTECSSPLTRSLGVGIEGNTLSSLRLLASNDSLLLGGGYEGLPGLLDSSTLTGLATLTQCMEGALRHPQGRVVFAGCGTSGRLSQFHAHTLNACWRAGGGGVSRGEGPFSYILAGGDAALVLSQESAEDSPAAALSSLASWEASTGGAGGGPVVLLGITCGLSAPFVSTLVDAALDRQEKGGNWSVFALGFNPLEALEGASGLGAVCATWQRLVAAGGRRGGGVAVLINPCLGPESVAGSSRLKGGSATSMVVNATAFEALRRAARGATEEEDSSSALLDALLEYSATVSRTYHHLTRGGGGGEGHGSGGDGGGSCSSSPTAAAAAAALCDSAGASLSTPSPHSPTGFGRVVYLGVGSPGVLGLIDASECPPTYGSLFDDVRGYLVGGLATLLPPHSLLTFPTLTIPPQLASRGAGGGAGGEVGVGVPPPPPPSSSSSSSPSIDLEGAFLGTVLPTLSPLDTVILVGIEGCGGEGEWECAFQACAASASRGAKVYHVTVGALPPSQFHATLLSRLPLGGVHIPLPALGLPSQPPTSLPHAPALALQALKLTLNAITTLAHVHRGCVYQGRMIAMCISNCKLFHRGVGIVEEVGGVTPHRARACLVTAIHGRDVEEEGGWKEGVEGHVAKAVVSRDILPLAILLAKRPGLSVDEGRAALRKNTLVSKAIALV